MARKGTPPRPSALPRLPAQDARQKDDTQGRPSPQEDVMSFPQKYPKASHLYLGTLKAVGPFAAGKPSGITVHYTADRDLARSMKALQARELAYHVLIDRHGAAYQTVDLTSRVWHAGKAMWLGEAPNHTHLAVSLVSWGELEELAAGAYQAWNGTAVPTSDVASRLGGHWDAATAAQEASLVEFLAWACSLGIAPEAITGHDECCVPKGRKVDPGGVLSTPMEGLRDAVRSRLGGKA